MEVAGFVLTVYPATILAFENYKKGAKYFSNWVQFRRKYEAFIRDMEGQQLFFEGILQDLMCGGPDPFLTGTDSKDSFLRIVKDATYTGWRDPRLKARLKIRLDTRYDWCIHTIQRVYDILEELGKLLDIQALESSNHTPDWWKYQWKRITQTLFIERYDSHQEAKRLIEELKQMVDLSDKQRRQGAVSTLSSFAPFFKTIRENANNLHEVLKNGWHCYCSNSHKAMLQLERKAETGGSKFNLLFLLSSLQQDESRTTTAAGSSTNSPSSRMAITSEKATTTDALATTDTTTDYVRQEVLVEISKHESNDAVEHSSSRTSDNTPDAENGSQENSGSTASHLKSSSNLSVPSKGSRKDLTISKTAIDKPRFQVLVTDMRSTFRNKFRGRKSDATTIYEKGTHVEKTVRKFTVAETMMQQCAIDQEPSIRLATAPKSTTSTPSLHSSQGHQIAAASSLISDICHVIQQPPVDVTLGYLKDARDNCYEFLSINRSISNPQNATAMTLDEILEINVLKPYMFPPEKRAVVATILASSLLQLQRTHWLKDNWSKKDILFNTKDGKILFEHPYLSQEFVSTPSPIAGNIDVASQINDNPLLRFHPKTSLECLGIILIELCFGMPIERWQDKVRLRPLDSSDQPNHEFCLAIAHAWTWEEIWSQEPLFSDPINSCLHFPGLGRVQEGRYDEVIHDMYSLIAKPLYDETTRRWPPRLDLSVHY